MDLESQEVNLVQPVLFDLGDTSSGVLELFPAVWGATEALASPDLSARQSGLQKLIDLKAARLSPLVVYVIATRLAEPDLHLRVQIVKVLAEVLRRDAHGQAAPEVVRQTLKQVLAQMRKRPIFELLHVVQLDPASQANVAVLLNACPHAGNHLADILANRDFSLEIRFLAAEFIGLVGYIAAIPALERLATRLESRLNGQQTMGFIQPRDDDEVNLLPAVKQALAQLRAA